MILKTFNIKVINPPYWVKSVSVYSCAAASLRDGASSLLYCAQYLTRNCSVSVVPVSTVKWSDICCSLSPCSSLSLGRTLRWVVPASFLLHHLSAFFLRRMCKTQTSSKGTKMELVMAYRWNHRTIKSKVRLIAGSCTLNICSDGGWRTLSDHLARSATWASIFHTVSSMLSHIPWI